MDRYFRSFIFDTGLILFFLGGLTAVWLARDLIAMMLKISWLRFSGEGGAEGASMNLSGFVLAALLALIGLAVMLIGAARARQGSN